MLDSRRQHTRLRRLPNPRRTPCQRSSSRALAHTRRIGSENPITRGSSRVASTSTLSPSWRKGMTQDLNRPSEASAVTMSTSRREGARRTVPSAPGSLAEVPGKCAPQLSTPARTTAPPLTDAIIVGCGIHGRTPSLPVVSLAGASPGSDMPALRLRRPRADHARSSSHRAKARAAEASGNSSLRVRGS